MKLELKEFSEWNDDFILDFIDLKLKLQGSLPTYFPEEVSDYKKFLHPDSPFAQDYKWHGFLVYSDGVLVAKAILAWRNGSRIGNVGFIDWINDIEVAKKLVRAIDQYAKASNFLEIKTPVDFNFFVKYRIKSKGQGKAYYGEPIYPDYYHQLFRETGFDIVGTWNTYEIKRFSTFSNFAKKRKKQIQEKRPHLDEVNIRFIKLSNWEEELKIVHSLFIDSFKDMPEFDPIDFEQFKLLYNDFRYIIHPWMSFIVEFKGKPIAFSINYPDPLEILSKVKNKKLSLIEKALLLVRLRLNFKTLLMPYMGKTTGPNGEEVKGVFVKLSKVLSLAVLGADKSLICYQSPDSPSKRPIDLDLVNEYAEYVLYGKKLE